MSIIDTIHNSIAHNSKENNTMDMYIKSLDVNRVDYFINPSTDRFGRIDRRESEFNHTVDLLINIRSVIVSETSIIIFFPDDSVCTINCPSKYYHKIEVL